MTTPCPKCSEVRWHPYPEEKPEKDGRYWVQYNVNDMEPETCTYSSCSDGFGWRIGSVLAWMEIQIPHKYTRPPKKKTVRVRMDKVLNALKPSIKYNPLSPSNDLEWIEIEADS